ncbi:DNA helicase RecG, partial [Patescibacteria group bacterium]|nr:DNA helicase RecG [Patescibacteria group bacterium]
MRLLTPVENIPKIGPVYAKKLKKMGIQTAGDLLFHFPVRYIDFSQIKNIADLKINEPACVKGTIENIKNEISYRRRLFITKAVVKDDSGIIGVTWFNQPYLANSLKKGDMVYLAGKITISNQGAYLSSPTYEKISPVEGKDLGPTHTARLVPVYEETRGMTSRWLRYIIKPLLFSIKDKLPETLPSETIKENKLLGINNALSQIHFPDNLEIAEQAKQRFAFEELFFLELFVLSKKQEMEELNSIAIPLNLEKVQDFVKSLNFKLTKSQKKVSWQILKDLEKQKPMSRLLQGDVGSGKTIVAALIALNVI